MYRILETLEPAEGGWRIEKGTLDRLDKLSDKSIRLLLEKGCIAEVEPLPLAVLMGWEYRTRKLAKVEVVTINDLLERETTELAQALGMRASTVDKWKVDAERILDVGGNGNGTS